MANMVSKAELRRTMGAYKRSKKLSYAQIHQRREAALISAARRRGRAADARSPRTGHIYRSGSRYGASLGASSAHRFKRAAVPSRKRHGRYWWPAGQF